MTIDKMFSYSWTIDPKETEITAIRVYGINENNENICLRINNFTPFIYLELPENIQWNTKNAQLFGNKLDDLLGVNKPIKKVIMYKEKLFYSHVDENGNKKKFPYFFLSFSNKNDIKLLSYKLRRPIVLNGLGLIRGLKIHEQDADPVLQFTSIRNIPTAGWLVFRGIEIIGDNKITSCDYEYNVKWKDVSNDLSNNKVAYPKVMTFDCEVNSTVVSAMPKAEKPGDKIFQISCIISRTGENNIPLKYLLTLGTPDQKTIGNDVNVICFETESDLIIGYTNFIQEHNPNVVIGYNILCFDIPYMIARAKLNLVFDIFDKQSFYIESHSKERTIKWSSTAFKNQEFEFIDAEGRLFIDLYPIIKRDYKLDNYRLKTVSEYFIGCTKDPLTPKGIFKCYRMGMKGDEKGNKALGICGKYCIVDSELTLKLFEKLQTWIGLTEMAKTCNVPIFSLYTAGQQIKVFSQVYKKCMYDNIVVEKDGYITKDNEHYQGATVFDPVPGVYDRIIPLDFSSLYPSLIIAYNLDYSTLVIDENISDVKCNVVEFDEHIGCVHDTTKRKTKPKHILCGHKKYRFLKEPKGVLPTILQNLLDARANTRSEMGELKKQLKITVDENDKKNILTLLTVLDKRQLAYKISANSMYGACGVQRGYLPMMPIAICTTAMGRKSIELVAKTIPEKYGGVLVYGDTDSNYVSFPHLQTAQECWDYAEYVADEVSKLFPPPMKLSFEEVIYWRFFILTKKRYMSLACDRNGIMKETIEKKGVLLARRDNCPFIRKLYGDIIMKIFNKETNDNIVHYLMTNINKLCSGSFSYKDFIVTKSVGNVGDMEIVPFRNEKNKLKAKIGDYTVPILETDIIKRTKQFKLKDCTNINEEENIKEYYLKCLPAQVQLAQKMKERGQRVDTGSRLEYIVTVGPGIKSKQYEKIESSIYYENHKDILEVDFMYYVKNITNPMDQVLNIILKEQNIVNKNYKFRLLHVKLIEEIKSLFNPILEFEGEPKTKSSTRKSKK